MRLAPRETGYTRHMNTALALMAERGLWVTHLMAAEGHEEAARAHDAAAEFWRAKNQPKLATLEVRNAVLERLSAELERERAEVAATERPHRFAGP